MCTLYMYHVFGDTTIDYTAIVALRMDTILLESLLLVHTPPWSSVAWYPSKIELEADRSPLMRRT